VTMMVEFQVFNRFHPLLSVSSDRCIESFRISDLRDVSPLQMSRLDELLSRVGVSEMTNAQIPNMKVTNWIVLIYETKYNLYVCAGNSKEHASRGG
jgi:hypothetical protein